MAASDSNTRMDIDETQQVATIDALLRRDDLPAAVTTPTSIFKLPAEESSYFPRRLALGPLHHFRQELNKMELLKLHNASKFLTDLRLPEFNELVGTLKLLDLKIRSCFDRRLDMGSETLAQIMIIDSFFLLALISSVSDGPEYKPQRIKLPLPNIFDAGESLRVQYEVLDDILMLVNQIPFLVLKDIIPRNLDEKFHLLLYRFCISISPFELSSYWPPYDYVFMYHDRIYTWRVLVEESHHFLHLLCILVSSIPRQAITTNSARSGHYHPVDLSEESLCYTRGFINTLSSGLNIPFLYQLNEAMGFIKSSIELLKLITERRSPDGEKPPIVPSVSELQKFKICFRPLEMGELMTTHFHETSSTLFLPVITLDAFSETLLRNLVAYEAKAELKPPCLTLYITLMSGLIVTVEDVSILRRSEIIRSYLDDDEQVVKLFEGTWKWADSLRSTESDHVLEIHCADEAKGVENDEYSDRLLFGRKAKHLKDAVREINEYYGNHWRVKTKKFIYKNIQPTVKVIFYVQIIVLAALLVTRFVCSFFGCPKVIKPIFKPLAADGSLAQL